MKTRGRPKKHPAIKRSQLLVVRLTEAELALIKERAERASETVSTFVRALLTK